MTAEAEVGKIYRGKVVTIKDFGAFVEFMPGRMAWSTSASLPISG
jgi:polyribonucleotide nucleotidyltransferase